MKSLQPANLNALIASLLWGLILNIVVRIFRQFLTDGGVFNIVQYGGSFLALALYPVLLLLNLRRKFGLWINACFFAMIGEVYSVLIRYVVDAFQLKAWMYVVYGLLGILFIGQMLISNIARNFAVQEEWESPFWEKLNQFSFLEFFFLRFDSLSTL